MYAESCLHRMPLACHPWLQVMQQHMEPTVAGPQAMAVNGLAGPEAVLKSVSDGEQTFPAPIVLCLWS